MTKKRMVCNVLIYNILFFVIYFFTKHFLGKNEIVCENIERFSIFIYILMIVIMCYLACKYTNIPKMYAMYISCLTTFQMGIISLSSSAIKMTLKSITIEIISIIVCILILKFFDNERLKGILDKFSVFWIIFVNCIVLSTGNAYVISAFSTIIIIKCYYILKKYNAFEEKNIDVLTSLILFSMFNPDISVGLLVACDLKDSMSNIKIEFE